MKFKALWLQASTSVFGDSSAFSRKPLVNSRLSETAVCWCLPHQPCFLLTYCILPSHHSWASPKQVQSGLDIPSTHRFPPEFLEPHKELCTTEKGFGSFFLQSHGGVSSPRNTVWGERGLVTENYEVRRKNTHIQLQRLKGLLPTEQHRTAGRRCLLRPLPD